MATIFWNTGSNGNWTTNTNWNSGTAPGSTDDAVLGITGSYVIENYTVAVTAPISVNSVTISDAGADLAISSPGAASVAANVSNSGTIDLEYGGSLQISGDLSNHSSAEGTAVVNVDTGTGGSPGGSTLTVAGALDNTGVLNIGRGNLSAPSLVSAATLDNNGTINITGNAASGNTQQAVLEIAAAPTTWTGTVTLGGQALLEFGSGGIGTIAQGAEIYLATSDGYIADAGATTSNSGLTGLTGNAGDFELQYGAAVDLAGDLNNTGSLNIDTQTNYGNAFSGGSALSIAGTLTNSGALSIGGRFIFGAGITATSTVSVGALDNTGIINLAGNLAAGAAQQAVLNVAAAAPASWTGTLNISGQALLEFGGGEIADVTKGAEIYLASSDGYIADAGATTSNSALTGLASVEGDFELQYGATVDVSGDLHISGSLNVDTQTNYGDTFSGGSTLAIAGALTNSGSVDIGGAFFGNGGITATSTISANALNNAGTISLYGNSALGDTKQAVLDITSAAPSTWTGSLFLNGQALLEFGSGQIGAIAKGAEIYFGTSQGYIADAGDTTSNSALTGLTANAGDFELQYGASVNLAGDFDNSGTVNVDTRSGNSPSGGSTLAIAGTLTNSATLTIGNAILTAEAQVSAAALDNTSTGTINIVGDNATGHEALLDVAGAAPTTLVGAIGLGGGANNGNGAGGDSVLEFGSGQITGIAQTGALYISNPNSYVADAGDTTSNSALTGLTENAGTFGLHFGVSVALSGDFANSGGVYIDNSTTYGINPEGGSSLAIAGTLTNSGTIVLGNSLLAADTTITAHALDNLNAGSISLVGDRAAGHVALLDITSAAPTTISGSIYLGGGSGNSNGTAGDAVLEFASGQVSGIGQGATLYLSNPGSFVADAGATTSNSALTGLTGNQGDFELQYGVAVAAGGDFSNSGTIKVDTETSYGNNPSGGSALTIAGKLTNSGTIDVGNNILTATSIMSAGALDNTGAGTINIVGDNAAGHQAVLAIAGAAPTLLQGQIGLGGGGANGSGTGGDALLEFGSGQITGIALGASLYLSNPNAYVADSGATTSNSALTGLTSNAGTLGLHFGETVALSGDFANSGGVYIDNSTNFGSNPEGGSALTIAGTLTNSGAIVVGNPLLSAATALIAHALDNASTGTIAVYGAAAHGTAFSIAGPASNAGALYLYSGANAQAASLANTGSFGVFGVAGTPSLFSVNGSVDNSGTATVGPYAEMGVSGAFTDSGVVNVGGTLDLAGTLEVTSTGVLTMQGGQVFSPDASVLTVDAGGAVSGNGAIATALVNNATVTASGGLLDLSGSLTGGGSLGLTTGAELELGGATAEAFSFNNDVGTLKLDQPGSFTGAINGLVQGDAIDLAGVRATGVVVNGSTLTVTAGAQTFSYQVSGSGLAGNSFALEDDQQGGTDLVLGPPGPTISGPKTQTAFLDWSTVLGPLTIADPNAGTGLLTVTLTAGTGALGGVAANAGMLTGSGSNKLVLTGDLADINTMLASVIYAGVAAGATDNVQIVATDASNATDAQTIAVTTDQTPYTTVLLNALQQQLVVLGVPTALNGLSVSDPYAQATGQQITITAVTGRPTFTAHGDASATVIGQGADVLAITGTVQQIQSYIGDDISEGFTVSAAQISRFTAADNIIVDQALDIILQARYLATEMNDIFTFAQAEARVNALIVRLVQTAQANPNVTAEALESFALPAAQLAKVILARGWAAGAGGLGGALVNIVTFSGQSYDLNAAGEFVLAKSSASGDSFLVEARLEPYDGSQSVSAMTQIAAQVGGDRVTFAIGRQAMVWIDGSASNVGPSNPVTLGGGTITQPGPETYVVTWNTGEILTVVNNGSYLDVSVNLGPNDSGRVEGLMGPNQGQANDFTLPDGTVLQQPLTTSEIYNTFANAWRVTASTSLFDYSAGQSTTTFTDPNFPDALVTLADLPANVVARAAQAVTAAGVVNAVAATEFDYIASGGDPSVIATDQSLFHGQTTTPAATSESAPAPVVLGVIAPVSSVRQAQNGPTTVTFDVYLTAPESSDTEVDYAVVDASANDFSPADFGGTLPSGAITIAAGQTEGVITIAVPQGALGARPSADVALKISTPGAVPIFAPNSAEAVGSAQATAPSGSGSGSGSGGGSTAALPQLEYLGAIGTFSHSGNSYTLDLGDVTFGQVLQTLQFGIANGASVPGDELTGSFTWSRAAGFSVSVDGNATSGAGLLSPVAAGSSAQVLTVTTIQNKFGAQSQTIAFTPVDTNSSGYSSALTPITLTIADTLEAPGTITSQAWGDVHIITYNGLHYNFQAAGEFTLAESNVSGDSFDVQLRLQPYNASSAVTTIQQVAVSLGADRVTFGVAGSDGRAATVLVDGKATTLSMSNPTLTLAGGSITEISPNMWTLAWNTGETTTVTESTFGLFYPYFNVSDSAPYAAAGSIMGLQGWNEGTQSDFQLPDGTILQQPLTSAELYGEYANAWRVTPTTSLFDYGLGQSTATFTDPNFPPDQISLADLPASVVSQAAALVAAAGITDPVTATNAELDYIATGDPSFISAAANINQQVTNTVAPTITPSAPATPAIGVAATQTKVAAASTGATAVTFTAYLTAAQSTDTTVDYAVIASGADALGASAFGGVLPSGSLIIAAGQTTAQFTVDLPQGALGATPDANLHVQVRSPGDAVPIFAPTAQTEIVNSQPEAGNAAVPVLAYLGKAGTFTFDQATETYTLDFGGVTQGAAPVAAEFAVINAATAPADSLAGTFSAPIGQGFFVTGDNLATPLAAGETYQGLFASVNAADLGANAMSMTFNPEDINDSGYSSALAPITLKIVDTVTRPAKPQVNTPTTIIFPNAHVGAIDSQHVSVTNTAPARAQSLDVTLTAGGHATESGAVSQLAPGATDASDLTVGIGTSTAGALNGSVTEKFASHPSGGASAPIAIENPYIDVFGDVYRLAAPSVSPGALTVHVGDSGSQTITITNLDPNDGYSENLIATVVGTTGGVIASGTTGDIKPQADGAIAVHFSSATAGAVGTVTLDLKSDGTGIDGLGLTDLGNVSIPVTVTSGNISAIAQFEELSGGGTFTQSGSAYSLNLGTINAPVTVALGVLNSAAAPADTLAGSFTISGDSAFANTGFGSFSGVAAGQANVAPSVTLGIGAAGTFSETITLSPVDDNGGANPALPTETLTITGAVAVVPPTVTIAPVDGDNVINNAQAHAVGGVVLNGKVSGLSNGTTFLVTVVDGAFDQTYTATVNAAGTGWTATIPESDAITLADGTATVTTQVTDPYGNQSAVANDSVTVAETLPTVSIAPVDGDNVINNARAITLGGVALSGTVSGLAAGATFSVTVTDGGFDKTYTATVNSAGTGWTATLPESDAITLAAGTAKVTTQVTDAYGNESAVANDSVTVVETLPAVTIAAVAGDDVINNAEADAAGGVALSGTVSGLPAGATFFVRVVDGGFDKTYTATVNAAGTGWTATLPKSDAITLPDGTAKVTTQVADAYGNESSVADDSVIVAETLPVVTIAEVEGDNIIDYEEAHAAGGVALSGTVSGLAAGATFSVRVVDGGFDKSYAATVDSAATGWIATLPESAAITLPDGAATVTTQAADAYGNLSAVASDSVTVAETLPTVTITTVNGVNVINHAQAHAVGGVVLSGTVGGLSNGATFLVTVVDGAFDQTYMATVNAAGTGWTATLPESDALTLADGTATVRAQATDAYGNLSAAANDSVIVAETLPTVSIAPVTGDNVIDNAEAKAAGGITLSGTVTGLAAGATFSVAFIDGGFNKTYTASVNAQGTGWTATIPKADAIMLADGAATVTAQATDAYGNQSAVANDRVSVQITGTAFGDVHLATYDGLHYDFQADGAFVLTRSTAPGDNFQIQIETSPYPLNNAASITTELAAQVGNDVLNFDPGRANFILVDGVADTTLGSADPVQTFGGGTLTEVTPSIFQIDWNSGQSLTVIDEGYYIDSSVTLGLGNGPGSVEGLLGPDEGQANDFQLPDGSILQQPLGGDALYGVFEQAWSVTEAESILGGTATASSAQHAMPLAYAHDSGASLLEAAAPGEILSAASGADILADAGGFGVTFAGSLSDFSHTLIENFSSKDVIDAANINAAQALLSYAGSASTGVLTVNDGSHTGEIFVSGALANGSFHVAPSITGGATITFG